MLGRLKFTTPWRSRLSQRVRCYGWQATCWRGIACSRLAGSSTGERQ